MVEVRIENTNRCGYSCVFCPREKMTRLQGIMPIEDFKLVMSRVNEYFGAECTSIHLHGFGEALLDPMLPKKIGIAKNFFPNANILIVTTLGVKVHRNYLSELIESGLDEMIVSFYSTDEEGYKKVTGTKNLKVARENLVDIALLVKEHKRPKITVQFDLVGNVDIGELSKRHSDWLKIFCDENNFNNLEFKLHNYGSGRNYNAPTPGEHVCSVVKGHRHDIIQITWDLRIKPCCFDFNAEMSYGSLKNHTFSEIYQSINYLMFIEKQKQLDFSTLAPCRNCDRRD